MSSEKPHATKVFLEYGHGSKDHQDAVFQFACRLREMGVDASLDQFEESPPEGWPQWMKDQVAEAKYVLVICSPELKQKLESASASIGKGAKFESRFTLSALYEAAGQNDKFIPVLLNDGDDNIIPDELKPYTHYLVSDQHRFDRLYARLTDQPLVRKPPLGIVVPMTGAHESQANPSAELAVPALPKKDRVSEFEPYSFLLGHPEIGTGLACKTVNIENGSLVGTANCGMRIVEWQARSFREGQRILVELTSLPAGVRIGVPNRIDHPTTKTKELLRRLEGTDRRGANGDRTNLAGGLAEVDIRQGWGTVAFEFVGDTQLSSLTVPIVVGWDGSDTDDHHIGVGSIQASISLAPISESYPCTDRADR